MIRGIPMMSICTGGGVGDGHLKIRLSPSNGGVPTPADPCGELGYDSQGNEFGGAGNQGVVDCNTGQWVVYDGRSSSDGVSSDMHPGQSCNWGEQCGSNNLSAWSIPHPNQVFCYDVKIVEDEYGVKNTVVFESWYGGDRGNLPIVFLNSTLASMFKDRIGSRDIGDPNATHLPGLSYVRYPDASELWEAEPWEYLRVTMSENSVNYGMGSWQCEPEWPDSGMYFTSVAETSFLSAASIGGRDPYAVENTLDFDVITSAVQCESYLDIEVKPTCDPEAVWPDGQDFNEQFTFRIYFNDYSNNYMAYVSDPDHPGTPDNDPLVSTGGIIYADTGGAGAGTTSMYDGGIYVNRHDDNLDDSSVLGFTRMKDDKPLSPGEMTDAIVTVLSNPRTRIRINDTAGAWSPGIPSGWTILSRIPAWRRLRFEAVGGKLRVLDIAARTELRVIASGNSILGDLVEHTIDNPGDQYVQGNLYHENTRQVSARFTQAGFLPWSGLSMPGPGTQGSFYRNLRITSDSDRYYDSMTPSPTTYHQSRGKDLLGFYGTHLVVGQPNPGDGGVIRPEVTEIHCGDENGTLEDHSILGDGLETSIEGCWFTIYDASDIAYNVWYDIDGRGDIGYPPNAPSDPPGVLIKVEDINMGADRTEVAQKTAAAIGAYPQFIVEYEDGDDYFLITNSGNGIAPDARFPGVEGVQDRNTDVVIGGAPGGAGASEDGSGPNTEGGLVVNNHDANDWWIEVSQQGTDAYPEKIAKAVDDSWLAAFPFEASGGELQRELFVRDDSEWDVLDAQDMLSDLAPAGSFGSSQSGNKFSTMFVTGSVFGFGPNPGTNMPDPWAGYGSNTRHYGAQGFISDDDGNIYFEKSQTVRDNVYRFYFGSGRGWAHSPILSQSDRWRYIPHIRGWKYGLVSGLPLNSSMIFRSDRFGQYRDLLEQRQDTRYFRAQDKKTDTRRHLTSSPVRCRFLDPDGDATSPDLTWSQNLSLYCTSSLPFFDDNEPRNREPIDPATLNMSTELVD